MLSENALQILEKRYLLKDKQGIVQETPEQLFQRVAKAIADVEKQYGNAPQQWEKKFYNAMNSLEFLPNTPTLMNAGTRLGNLAACYVLPVEDSTESIFETLRIAALLHHEAAGTGFSFSQLRPKGDIVASSGGIASGPVSFIEIYDKMTEIMKQGGKRRGANMGVLSVHHPDVAEFITTKTKRGMLENFNISVAVTDAFMRTVQKDQKYPLINPRTRKVVKEINAGAVFDLIIKTAWRTGDPGLLFIDEINKKNPTKQVGIIEATNPCGEIPLHPWEACNLGSINLAQLCKKGGFDWRRLQELTHLGVRFLDNVIDAGSYPVPQIEQMVKANRRIGLGVMGFADCLIRLGIPYDSQQALHFAAQLMRNLEAEAHTASQQLGKEKGNFSNFERSLWQKKNKYKNMRNATVTTIAPTGTISIIAGCSSGIEPLFAIAFVRNIIDKQLLEVTPTFQDIVKQYNLSLRDVENIARTGNLRQIKKIPKKVKQLFVTALEISPEWHVRMQAAFQKCTDNAVSKTINLPKNASVAAVRNAYLLAWKLHCKGITVYRYGSKEKQVLTFSKKVIADLEFAGGCEGLICHH